MPVGGVEQLGDNFDQLECSSLLPTEPEVRPVNKFINQGLDPGNQIFSNPLAK